MVLIKMRETTESHLGASITNAIVTLPAYSGDSKRQATEDVSTTCGLNVLPVISEPTPLPSLTVSIREPMVDATSLFSVWAEVLSTFAS